MRHRVFFGPVQSILKCVFMDVAESPDYEYCDFGNQVNNRFKEILMSSKIHNYLPHFVQRKIYRKILGYDFLFLPRDTEIFFAFTNGYAMYGEPYLPDFLHFLKKEFCHSKYAIHYYETLLNCYPDQLPVMKECFDYMITFDHNSAENFDIEYYGPVCEKGVVMPAGEGEESDVLYIAGVSQPKFNRVEFVARTFRELADRGKMCIFSLHNAKEADKRVILDTLGENQVEIKEDCFIYRDSKFYFRYFTYPRALSYILKTKVMLEIVPRGVISCTSRLAQAFNAEKKLLTTSDTCTKEPFYHPNNIASFDEPENIDLSFFDTPYHPVEYDLTPLTMLKYLEDKVYHTQDN